MGPRWKWLSRNTKLYTFSSSITTPTHRAIQIAAQFQTHTAMVEGWDWGDYFTKPQNCEYQTLHSHEPSKML